MGSRLWLQHLLHLQQNSIVVMKAFTGRKYLGCCFTTIPDIVNSALGNVQIDCNSYYSLFARIFKKHLVRGICRHSYDKIREKALTCLSDCGGQCGVCLLYIFLIFFLFIQLYFL